MQQPLKYIVIGGLAVLALAGCTPAPVDQGSTPDGEATQEQETQSAVEVTEDLRYEDNLYSVQLQKLSLKLPNAQLALKLENAINTESDQLAAEVIQLREELVDEKDGEKIVEMVENMEDVKDINEIIKLAVKKS